MIEQKRQEEYFALIDRLLHCPNGKEPEILDANLELIDESFLRAIIQVATMMAHDNNQEAAQFLIFIARQLSKQLGLYPEVSSNC